MVNIPNFEHPWGEVKVGASNGIVDAGGDSRQLLVHAESAPSWNSREASIATDNLITSWPRHIFVAREDVTQIREAVAQIGNGRAVPFQFHLQCEGSDREHPVDEQPGRTFYVVDNRVAAALKAGGSGSGASGSAAGGTLLLYNGIPVYRDTIESLTEGIKGKTAPVSEDEELRVEVEKEMQSSRAGEWISAFLNAGPDLLEFQAFKDDFRLRKVEYLTSASTVTTAWLCNEHCKEGLDQGMVRRIL